MPKRVKENDKSKVVFVGNGTHPLLKAGKESKPISRSRAERLEASGYGEIKKSKK